MWWGIRTVVEAEFAVIAFLLNFSEVLCGEFRDVAFEIVNPVEQGVEGRTQVETAATAVTNIKDPQRFCFKIRPLPPGSNEVKFWHDKICGRVLFLESCII